MNHQHGSAHERHNHDHHGRGHHDHGHSHVPTGLRALLVVLSFTALIFLAELIGGWYSKSLALMSDAMHMLSDSTGLVVAAVAMVMGRRGTSKSATYGHKRLEVVAALVNAVSVSAISVWIVIEAIGRLRDGGEVHTTMMLVIGVIGLVANLFGAMVLRGHAHDNLNLKGAYLHVLVDLFGSVAVIIAAIVMKFTNFLWADTVASLIIAALILPRSLKLAMDTLRVLLEHAPVGVDTDTIVADLQDLPQVTAVHDMHVWSLDGQELLATCHVVVSNEQSATDCKILDQVQQKLRDFGIEHSTIQLETGDHLGHENVCHH